MYTKIQFMPNRPKKRLLEQTRRNVVQMTLSVSSNNMTKSAPVIKVMRFSAA
jgi:hypothetical protein